MSIRFRQIAYLVGVNLVYACTSVFTKMASRQEIMSRAYLIWIASAVGVMVVYALLWQQIIKHMPISTVYMFKGTSLIFGLLIAGLLFAEPITQNNIIGATIIITGIALYAKA